jgi:hypothetical protein
LSKSVSTIEEVKARSGLNTLVNVSDSLEIDELLGTLQLSSPGSAVKASEADKASAKLDALGLLSSQMKTVKSSIYDFEDDVEDSESEASRKPEEIIEEVIETAEQPDSDESDF